MTDDWSRLPGARIPFNWRAFWQKYRILYRDHGGIGPVSSSLVSRLGLFGLAQIGWALDEVIYPRWRKTKMAPPVFILGHQRSGTTLLHRLLSEDKTHARSLFFHEMLLPAISTQRMIGGIGWALGERIRPRFGRLQDRMFGALDHIHRLRFDEIEEDEFVLWTIYASTMCINDAPLSTGHKDLDHLRDFHQWPSEEQIRALGWYRACLLKKVYRSPTAADQLPWIVSKNPHFSQKIPELLRVFPDARLIYLVRNPMEAIASRLDLIRAIWRHRFKNFHDMTRQQAETIVADSLLTYINAERDLYMVAKEQRMIVYYDDLTAGHVVQVVTQAYDHFNLPGPDVNLNQALALEKDKPAYTSRHDYDLAAFGIDAEQLRASLAPVFANHPIST